MVGGIDGLHTFRECSDYLHRAVIVRVKIESGEATREAHRELTSHSFLALVGGTSYPVCVQTQHIHRSRQLGATKDGGGELPKAGSILPILPEPYGGPEVTPDASHV